MNTTTTGFMKTRPSMMYNVLGSSAPCQHATLKRQLRIMKLGWQFYIVQTLNDAQLIGTAYFIRFWPLINMNRSSDNYNIVNCTDICDHQSIPNQCLWLINMYNKHWIENMSLIGWILSQLHEYMYLYFERRLIFKVRLTQNRIYWDYHLPPHMELLYHSARVCM